MSGFIKLHRSLLDWEWYSDKNCRNVFIHCLLKANYEDKKWQGVIIKRGSFITSLENLGSETGLTVQQIRTVLVKLKSTNDITIKTTNKFTALTVVNYSLYQDKPEKVTNKTTNKKQTNNKQITTTKEGKNNNLINKIINKGLHVNGLYFETWKDFVQHRIEIKKPLTEKAAEMTLKKLQEYYEAGFDKNKILETSIANGWQGVFLPNEKNKGVNNDKQLSKSARARAAVARSLEKV